MDDGSEGIGTHANLDSPFVFIPGKDTIKFSVQVFDMAHNIVADKLKLKLNLEVLICPQATPQATPFECNAYTAINDLTYFSATDVADQDRGQVPVSMVPECAIVPPVVQGAGSPPILSMQISLVNFPNVATVSLKLACGKCRAGEKRRDSASKRTWSCITCPPKTYIADPNNVAYDCRPCPTYARCQEGVFLGGVDASEWQVNTLKGVAHAADLP